MMKRKTTARAYRAMSAREKKVNIRYTFLAFITMAILLSATFVVDGLIRDQKDQVEKLQTFVERTDAAATVIVLAGK